MSHNQVRAVGLETCWKCKWFWVILGRFILQSVSIITVLKELVTQILLPENVIFVV